MKYDFDEIIKRDDKYSKKWDSNFYKNLFNGNEGLLPLWVADMDFKTPNEILKGFSDIIENGVIGYTYAHEKLYNAIIEWNKKRKKVVLQKDWIAFVNGVVTAIAYAIQTFTKENDKILIQTPVYHPFKQISEVNNRIVIKNSLVLENGEYKIDFEDFERKIKDNDVKLFIFCNPHNPVGRVWEIDEINKIAEICEKYNVLIISDEIHSDLVFKENKFVSFLNINEKYRNNLVVCTSPSKTFNLAGVQTSIIIIPDNNIRLKYKKTLEKVRVENPNTFGIAATEIAYTKCEEWLEEVIKYLDKNRKYIENYLKEYLPKAKYKLPEGTYLAWIDLRNYFNNEKDMESFFELKAKVAIDYGHWFGKEGKGFIRLNFACPTAILKESLDRIANNLK